MTWLLLKNFLSNAVAFIIAHWQVIIMALIFSYALHEKSAYERNVKAFDDYKMAQAGLVVKRQLDDAKNNADAAQLSTINQVFHNAEIARLNLDRDKIKKDLTNEKTIIANAISANRVSSDNTSGIRLPKVPTAAENTSSCGADCDRTIANLVEAGQSCAIDYNALWTEWDNNCKIYGCQ